MRGCKADKTGGPAGSRGARNQAPHEAKAGFEAKYRVRACSSKARNSREAAWKSPEAREAFRRRFLSDADQTFLGLIELPVGGSVAHQDSLEDAHVTPKTRRCL